MSTRNLAILIIVLVGLITSLILVTQPLITNSQATTKGLFSASSENSYIFASPIQAKANGQESIRITIFLLDTRGLGLENQPISLSLPDSVKIIQSLNITDTTGKATFDITSTTKQTVSLSANYKQQPLGQTLKVIFY